MKKIFLFFNLLFLCFSYGQDNKRYVFNVELIDKSLAPTFKLLNDKLVYSGNDINEQNFFQNYVIRNYYQTYSNYKSNQLLNIYTFITDDSTLMNDMMTQFPDKYIRVEDLSDIKMELAYYPNDYGVTSPVQNLGANLSLKSFDYINVPKAWNYFPNKKGNRTIGFSDGKIINTDADFTNKVSYLYENNFSPNFICGSDSWHGTTTAAVAAARGDNAFGMVGVCYDCDILNIPYTIDLYTPNFNGFMELASNGVTVINMSWIQGYNYNDRTYQSGFVLSQQLAINELTKMGVVLVAGAGNSNIFGAAAPDYSVHCFPASYENVISVSAVNHKNINFTDQLSTQPYGVISSYNEDLISPHGLYVNNTLDPFYAGLTYNSRVDICAPGYQYPLYGSYLLGCLDQNGQPSSYGDGTSGSAPYVTGTVALMQSLNSCLKPNEIEDILQLTSKNIESNQYNNIFLGKIGSGKLETGDSVEFVSEAMNSDGNALIDDQDFYRFDFDLQIFKNTLTISNQIFRDSNTSKFVAKKAINILSNSDFRPNNNGFIDLKVDSNTEACSPLSSLLPKSYHNNAIKENLVFKIKSVKLYPNPNNGKFLIEINEYVEEKVSVSVFDIFGKKVFDDVFSSNNFQVETTNLSTGIYFVKISSNNINETIKFIKK
jgi:subtilisin family serine protease